MWFIFGVIAIGSTFTNLYFYKTGKDYQLPMAMGLSFTAFTVLASYSMVSDWVKLEEWSSLLDVVPTMEVALWILTILSIGLNIVPIILELKKRTSLK